MTDSLDSVVLYANDVKNAIQYLRNDGLKSPYDAQPVLPKKGAEKFTKSDWEKVIWNPPQGATRKTVPDPEAAPKPTWATVVLRHRKNEVENWQSDVNYQYNHELLDDAKARIVKGYATVGGKDMHTGPGVSHLASMMHMADSAVLAGNHLPPILMRTRDDEPHTLYLQSELRDLLQKVSTEENIVESAHNFLQKAYKAKEKIVLAPDADYDSKAAAFKQWKAIRADYLTHLDYSIQYLQGASAGPLGPPKDLPTLRDWYIERLEAKALGTIKSYSRALTQQGVIAGAACKDEADAIEAVQLQARNGTTHILNSDNAINAKAAYDAAVAAIEAVTALNVPAWQVNGVAASQDGQTANFSATTTDRMLTIKPVNPSGTAAEGPLGIYPDWEYVDQNGNWVDITTTRTPNPIKIQLSVPQGTKLPLTATVRARNTCGDSTMVLTVENAS